MSQTYHKLGFISLQRHLRRFLESTETNQVDNVSAALHLVPSDLALSSPISQT